MPLALLSWLPLLLAPAPLSSPNVADTERVLAAVQRHHAALRDFQARFVQTYRSGALAREIVESGAVRFKRPGRMRWEYRVPEKKLFVSDGRRLYFYVPAERQVVVRKQGGTQTLAFRLLAAETDLAREFIATMESEAPGATRLRLVPRTPDADVEHILIEIDGTFAINGIEIHDVQGNVSRFRFEDVKENRGLADRVFHFEVPPNVEVVEG
jgi:outer membrane lipoprotein carrier protein